MTSIKCNQAGCTYVASHKRPGYAKALIGIHKSKVHGILGMSASALHKRKMRSEPQVVVSHPETETVTPNFCPCCGTSLRAITVALNLRKR